MLKIRQICRLIKKRMNEYLRDFWEMLLVCIFAFCRFANIGFVSCFRWEIRWDRFSNARSTPSSNGRGHLSIGHRKYFHHWEQQCQYKDTNENQNWHQQKNNACIEIRYHGTNDVEKSKDLRHCFEWGLFMFVRAGLMWNTNTTPTLYLSNHGRWCW